MDYRSANSLAKRNKVMSPEQFNQVVEAITDGRYSWACVLILRFAGYNPVYFIPYRTYSRLVKENQFLSKVSDHTNPISTEQRQPQPLATVSIGDLSATQCLTVEDDSTAMTANNQPESHLCGGLLVPWCSESSDNSVFKWFIQNQSLSYSRWS
jgi:hypothetical protein